MYLSTEKFIIGCIRSRHAAHTVPIVCATDRRRVATIRRCLGCARTKQTECRCISCWSIADWRTAVGWSNSWAHALLSFCFVARHIPCCLVIGELCSSIAWCLSYCWALVFLSSYRPWLFCIRKFSCIVECTRCRQFDCILCCNFTLYSLSRGQVARLTSSVQLLPK